jgi:hypothetical protein
VCSTADSIECIRGGLKSQIRCTHFLNFFLVLSPFAGLECGMELAQGLNLRYPPPPLFSFSSPIPPLPPYCTLACDWVGFGSNSVVKPFFAAWHGRVLDTRRIVRWRRPGGPR